jgi:tetratricopeptide (TPR) repeat protein
MNKGGVLTELGRNEEAVECFDKALEIDLGQPWAWLYLVSRWRSLDCLGRRKEALACLDKVLEIDPNNRDAYVTLGACFGLMGMYEKAIECYDKALKMNNPFINLVKGIPLYTPIPSDKDILCMIHSFKGHSFLQVGKPDEAISCLNKVLESNPDDIFALYEKGKVFVELRKYSEAVDCYDHVLKIDSNRGDVWYYKGTALIKLSRRDDDAQYCFDKAKKLGFNINSQEEKIA